MLASCEIAPCSPGYVLESTSEYELPVVISVAQNESARELCQNLAQSLLCLHGNEWF